VRFDEAPARPESDDAEGITFTKISDAPSALVLRGWTGESFRHASSPRAISASGIPMARTTAV
jgi:hypothetical protein